MSGKIRCVLLAILVFASVPIVELFAVPVGRTTLTTSPTLIYGPTSATRKLLVRNPSAVSVYIGTSAVLTTTGFEIAAGDAASFTVARGDSLYGTVAAATQVVHWADNPAGAQ